MIQSLLEDGAFGELFIEHLGWDVVTGVVHAEIDGQTVALRRVAQKRGLLVLEHRACRRLVQTRRYIKALSIQVSRIAHESLVIVVDENAAAQVWVWSYRDQNAGRWRHRIHPFLSNHIPAAVVRRIRALSIGLDEEEHVTLLDVSARVSAVLDAGADQHIFFRRPTYAQQGERLMAEMREGGTAEFHKFVMFHERLVRWVVKRYKRIPIDQEDMAQVAVIGLMRAARHFNPGHGASFSTYAFQVLQRECERYLVWASPLCRLPHGAYRRYQRLGRRLEQLQSRGLLPLSDEDYMAVLAEVGLTPGTAQSARVAFSSVSLNTLPRKECERLVSPQAKQPSFLKAGNDSTPVEKLLVDELRMFLRSAVRTVKHSDIIRRRFGLGCRPETLQEIADSLGRTKELVRQRETKALSVLRCRVHSWLGWPTRGHD